MVENCFWFETTMFHDPPGANDLRVFAENEFLLTFQTLSNAPVICNHGPIPTGRMEDSRAKLRGKYFLKSMQCRGNDRVLILRSLPQGDFLLRRAGQRA